MNQQQAYRYWGNQKPPKTKAEFFNAVTTVTPTGDSTIATIRMYGPIDSWGGFWGISAKDVSSVLDALPESVEQIILRINSPGGEVFEGISILNLLRAHRASVTAVVDGLAASAASVVAAACDEAVMSPGTQMMIHSPWVFSYGSATDLRKTAEVLDGIEASIVEIYQGKAGAKDWATLLADETWLTAAQAVELGLADRVAVVPDAGETATAGDEDPVEITDPDGDFDEPEDRAPIRFIARASSHQLPRSSEPGEPNRKETVVTYDTLKAGLRERLGVTDANASDEQLLTALEDQITAPAASSTIPATATVIDTAVLDELRTNAQAGLDARAELDRQRRDGIIDAALADGRIAPVNRDSWRTQLDENEAGTLSLLETMPKNTAVPVAEIGVGKDRDTQDSLYALAWGEEAEEN